MKSITFTFLSFVFFLLATLLPAKALEIQQVTTPSGIKVWLVEDYTVPLMSLGFEFSGGASQDPEGKQGLASILSAMMDEGAGDQDAANLKAELEERGIELGFSASQDNISGGMRILASEKERAFELLKNILIHPKFENAALERIKAGYISAQLRSNANPDALLSKKMRNILFPAHPYGQNLRGAKESLPTITRQDIINHYKALFAQDNLYLGVVGAINKTDLSRLIEMTFGALAPKANLKPIKETSPEFGARDHIVFDSPQTIVSMALPGIKRSDPDFFAAYIMNHILGGGTFSSRLYNEIREKRGLVYGIGTSLTTLEHAAYLGGGFATRSDQATEALDLMLDEINKMAKTGPTSKELERAKKYIIGAYAINNLDTSSKIADVLVSLQSSKLDIDYINTRSEKINSVTLEDIKKVAARLLTNKPTIVTVGPGDV